MSSKNITSAQIVGLEAQTISVEVDVAPGLRTFSVVGLPDKSVTEARERIFAALKNSGCRPPQKHHARVIVNLAPAELKKEGSQFDLAIAMGFLLASEQTDFESKGKMFLGELGLEGDLKPIRGTLAYLLTARKKGFKEVILPFDNWKDALVINGIKSVGVKTITELLSYLEGRTSPIPPASIAEKVIPKYPIELSDIKGQNYVKRALEIAAAGGHNLALKGPPGAGKSLLAKALKTLLPPLTFEEALEVKKIHSIAGLALTEDLSYERPFRSPHHSASPPSILGGGSNPQPGEVTLAHNGVLFLDEFPEFDRRIIEGLRQPLEDRKVLISRSRGSLEFPAKFILVAAMNPCPCGKRFDPKLNCICRPGDILRYEKKLSQPIIDRIDMWVEVAPVELYEMAKTNDQAETSKEVLKRINQARKIQKERFQKESITTNAEMDLKQVERLATLSQKDKTFLQDAGTPMGLSARGWHKVIKIARTIADLEENKEIIQRHLSEALQYRPKQIY